MYSNQTIFFQISFLFDNDIKYCRIISQAHSLFHCWGTHTVHLTLSLFKTRIHIASLSPFNLGIFLSPSLIEIIVYIGTVTYFPDRDAIIWSIKQYSGSKEYLMRAHFGLPSITGTYVHCLDILFLFQIGIFFWEIIFNCMLWTQNFVSILLYAILF